MISCGRSLILEDALKEGQTAGDIRLNQEKRSWGQWEKKGGLPEP
jgi:hypothetical protein